MRRHKIGYLLNNLDHDKRNKNQWNQINNFGYDEDARQITLTEDLTEIKIL